MKSFPPTKPSDESAGALMAAPFALEEQCAMEWCQDRATRTGICEDCMSLLAMSLKREIHDLDSVVAMSLRELQRMLAVDDIVATLPQCNSIKCHLISQWHNIPLLHKDAPDPFEANLLQDYGRVDVADGDENRKRRDELFSSLPNRIRLVDEPVGFSPTELEAQLRLRREALHRKNPDDAPLDPEPRMKTSWPVAFICAVLSIYALVMLYLAIKGAL